MFICIHKYLYQGWAGNTYSHKCNVLNSGENSTIEYFEYAEDTNVAGLIMFATYLKVDIKDRGKMICPFSAAIAEMLAATTNTIIAIGINLHEKCIGDTSNGIEEITILDTLIRNGYTQEQLDAIPRITKEEFYSLEDQ